MKFCWHGSNFRWFQNSKLIQKWFKIQRWFKIPCPSGICIQGERQKYTSRFPPTSKDEGLKDIGHSMSIENLILAVKCLLSYLIHYDSLLWNATYIITICDNYFITNCNRSLWQNASGLLQNLIMTIYYKMRQFIQIATI